MTSDASGLPAQYTNQDKSNEYMFQGIPELTRGRNQAPELYWLLGPPQIGLSWTVLRLCS